MRPAKDQGGDEVEALVSKLDILGETEDHEGGHFLRRPSGLRTRRVDAEPRVAHPGAASKGASSPNNLYASLGPSRTVPGELICWGAPWYDFVNLLPPTVISW
jgi:hypothetical protein